MQSTTCQICERAIKATTGLIAHHGYRRPHAQHWQTSSCFGARHLPYEVNCDALPHAIARCTVFLKNQLAYLKDFIENPPQKLFDYDRQHDPQEFSRPEGYVYNPEQGGFSFNQRYELRHHNAIYQIRKSIESAERELPRLEKRLADWKPQQN